MEQFLAMGGYGGYVWPSYLLGALVLGGLYLVSRGELRRRERRLRALESRLESGGGRARRRGEHEHGGVAR
ncbi:MAG: heme exporter protein CcmD [Tistlia sp.]|uniref:heme exporter protein CcmD n=1 Tax=Tistlia sp. TaxID=3057121 RepID=UPI0034A5A168